MSEKLTDRRTCPRAIKSYSGKTLITEANQALLQLNNGIHEFPQKINGHLMILGLLESCQSSQIFHQEMPWIAQKAPPERLTTIAFFAILAGDDHDPFSFLGMHEDDGRASWSCASSIPAATRVAVLDRESGRPCRRASANT